MSSCTRCGHELGDGRFCTHCGEPVAGPVDEHGDWRTDTAERPRLPTPGAPRFPLFADEDPPAAAEEREVPARVIPPENPTPVDPVPVASHRRRSAVLPWLLGFAVLAVVAVLGAWLLFSGNDDPGSAQETPAGADRAEKSDEPSASAESPSPSKPADAASKPEPKGKPTDLAAGARVKAPSPARPSRDTKGHVVSYVSGNMLDADPTTAWRMAGDGTGKTITFRFDRQVRLRQVGLINGYAKTGSGPRGAVDWYSGNRRIRTAEWTFGDGTEVTQRLKHTRLMQTRKVDQVATRSVTLRLVEVSPPGKGRASRNYTAISGVRLFGTTR